MRDVLRPCGAELLPYRDSEDFVDATRQEYFDGIPTDWLARAVVFVDPDIGLETGTRGYMRGNGAEKYLLYEELRAIAARATDDSVIVIYQHLQRNASLRGGDIACRIRDLTAHLSTSFVWALQWDDLAFLVSVRHHAFAIVVERVLKEHGRRHHGSFFASTGVHRGGDSSPRIASLTPMPPLRKAMSTLSSTPGQQSFPIGNSSIDLSAGLQDILDCLNDSETRATYGAVAAVVGGIPQAIGQRLGPRRIEASWIVNASSGMPTGYATDQIHPALSGSTIIRSGGALRERLRQWQQSRA